MPINILNSKEGILNVLPPQTNQHLPNLEGFTSFIYASSTQDIELYKATMADNAMLNNILKYFEPEIYFNDQLKDHNITIALHSLSQIISKIPNKDLMNFINNDLDPLLENKKLFQEFQGMLIQS